ncbi:hypothetical protein ACFL2Q_04830 [Thermodesulfobacteriota bacterium]
MAEEIWQGLNELAAERSTLARITNQLRLLSMCIWGLTGANLSLAMAYGRLSLGSLPPDLPAWGVAILTACVFITGVCFDSIRRRGDVFFEAISNELHAGAAAFLEINKNYREEARESRILIRQFASASEVPLVPGKFGPGIMVLINVVLMGLVLFLRD